MDAKLKPLFTLIIFILITAPIHAQSPITAEVDRSSLSTDEDLTLTITVTSEGGMSTPQPSLPPLNGFEVVGNSSSTQVNIVNMNMTAKGVYRYRLRPVQTGELVIGPVSVILDGQTYSANPITIQVSQGNAPLQPAPAPGQAAPAPDTLSGQDFFVEAEVNNPAPYLGQQISYTFRFYQAVRLADAPSYDAPAFTGFWSKAQPGQNQYNIEVNGRAYLVTELNIILFPTLPGQNIIDPAALTIPSSFFQSGGVLQTEAISVDTQPLPPNAPADFKGAVGQYTLAAEVDAVEGVVNEPITLIVTLSGQGNIENLPDPVWPELPNWRSFESEATANTQSQNGQLSGSRVYERLMVPGAPGDFTIPAIRYAYFDPVAAEYFSIATEPIAVSIAPAEEEPPVQIIAGNNKETVEILASDIRHIKPVPTVLETTSQPLTSLPVYWLAWLLLLLLLTGNFVWQRRQAKLQSDTGLARSLQASRKAKKSLSQARKAAQDHYSAAGQILTTYLSDKLNLPVSGLTQSELAGILKTKAVEAKLIKDIQAILSISDMGRYAPTVTASIQPERLLDELEKLIDELEKGF